MAKENKSPVSKKAEDIKPEDKRKALETALTQIKKQFGEGAVMRPEQRHARGCDLHRLSFAGPRARYRRSAARQNH